MALPSSVRRATLDRPLRSRRQFRGVCLTGRAGYEESTVKHFIGRSSLAAVVLGAIAVAAPWLAPGRASAAIVAALEEPADSSTTNAGVALIQGWAFSTSPGAT